ncbi:microtubule-associated protein 4-like isoform X2 [Hyla sarda]|uniref:microtubule-associated protein 4-like isoform X2 n=1 Tax=Hyla sarda TaxID=327740 RepID=UPI0024C30087|nr:microtubule-associated protein 4-like isoform X2 [Hyla sarda]
MADLELVDALTDAPPEIEPEIKRDFISSLEAEPYDDVIGERFDKTDYVPLLDDDEANGPGNSQSSEGSHPSVLENGEHNTGDVKVSDPFGSTLDEDVLADHLLPPQVQICPAFTAQLPEHFDDGWISDSYSKSVDTETRSADASEKATELAFDEGWMTDSCSKSGATDTQSADASEKTTATFGETPSDDSTNTPFQVSQSDSTSNIWQPTAAEQFALGSNNGQENEENQLKPDESSFDASFSKESQLLPGLGGPYPVQPDREEPDRYNHDLTSLTSTSFENPELATENYAGGSLDNSSVAERSQDETACIYQSVESEQLQKDFDTEQVIPTSQTSIEPPQSPGAPVSTEPPLSPFELIQEDSILSSVNQFPVEIQAETFSALVQEEESPVSLAALDQKTESPASPAKLVQEEEVPASPVAQVQQPEVPAALDSLVTELEVPASHVALVEEAKDPASLVKVVQEAEPAAFIDEVEVPASPASLVQEAEAPASPIALIQEAEAPASPIDLIQEGEASASPIDLIQEAKFAASPIDLIQEAGASASPIDLIQEAGASASPIDLIQEAEASASPIDLIQEAKFAASPIDLIQEADTSASHIDLIQEAGASAPPIDLIQEAEASASPIDLIQEAEASASSVAVLQVTDLPSTLDAVGQEADAEASTVALAQDKEVPASFETINQEMENLVPQKSSLTSPAPLIPAEELTSIVTVGIQPPEQRETPLGGDDLQLPEDQGKTEAAAAPEEVTAGSDISAPPTKELPASPEKKVKAIAATPSKSAATPKSKPLAAASPRKPLSATPTQPKKPSTPAPATLNTTTPKRPLGSATKTTTPKDTKEAKPKSPVKTPERKPLISATTPRSAVKASPAASKPITSSAANTTGTSAPKPNLTPKRPTSLKNDVKATEVKKTSSAKSPTDLSRPKSVPADLAKSNGAAPTSPGPAPSRPKTSRPAASKPLTGPSATLDVKKLPAARPAPLSRSSTAPASKPSSALAASKPSAAPKQPRPATAPDLKNVRSKIGSTDNLKHQPGGGKVQIVSKKVNYSHVQSKCGSKDNIKHVPGGGNVTNAAKPSIGSSRPSAPASHKPVQILNKKVDVSKVSAKCGSKPIAKARTVSVDAKANESSKKTETTKQEPQESIKENGGEQVTAPQNGDLATPTDNTAAVDTRENGVQEMLPVDGGDQRETQSFNTLIPETN